ncbi:MAG: DUF3185 family protein [Bacteroidia bacterium]
MKKIIGIILLVAGIIMGVAGFMQMDDSQHEANLGPISIEATDNKGMNSGLMLLIAGAVATVGGIVLLVGKK